MKCPVCSHVYPDTLSRCSRCGRVAPEAQPAQESKSSLIEFPHSRQARPSLPDWRVELNEKVRAVKARRTMEALVDEASSARQATIAPPTPVIVPAPLPEPEQEPSNPIVAAALDRVRRASENAARVNRTTGPLGAAVAAAAAPAFELSPPPPVRDMTARVVPIANALVAPTRAVRPVAPIVDPEQRAELFDPAELLDGLDEDLTLLDLENAQRLALGPAPADARRASLASRGVAALVDVALFCVVSVPFVATTYAIDGDFSRPAVVMLLASTLVLLGVFYLFTMFAIGGRTVGMMLSRTRVVDLDGAEPSSRAVFLRVVGSVLALIPAGLGFAWILFDRERRGWHDLLSNTRVVED